MKVVTLTVGRAVLFFLGTALAGCGEDGLDGYSGYGGEWPQYEGRWRSAAGNLVGSKYATRGCMEISIDRYGVFSGTCRDYKFLRTTDYGWLGSYSIYSCGGKARRVAGAIDFDKNRGEMTFEDWGKTFFNLSKNKTPKDISFFLGSDAPYTYSEMSKR